MSDPILLTSPNKPMSFAFNAPSALTWDMHDIAGDATTLKRSDIRHKDWVKEFLNVAASDAAKLAPLYFDYRELRNRQKAFYKNSWKPRIADHLNSRVIQTEIRIDIARFLEMVIGNDQTARDFLMCYATFERIQQYYKNKEAFFNRFECDKNELASCSLKGKCDERRAGATSLSSEVGSSEPKNQ